MFESRCGTGLRVRHRLRIARAAVASAVASLSLVVLPGAGPAVADLGDGPAPPSGIHTPAVPPDQIQDLYVLVGAGGSTSVATCRDGDYVVNGGWAAELAEASVEASWPTEDARGWEVRSEAGTVWAHAVCVRMAPEWTVSTVTAYTDVVRSECPADDDECTAESSPMTQTAWCRPGQRVIGGGWASAYHDQLLQSRPEGVPGPERYSPAVGWTVTSTFGGARALCAAASGPFGDVHVSSTPLDRPVGSTGVQLRADCRPGSALIGGGFAAGHDTLIRNHPVAPAGWLTEQSTANLGAAGSFALCAPFGNGISGAAVTPVAHVPRGGGEATASCPDGTRVIGGGVSVDPHPTAHNSGMWLSAPTEAGTGWKTVAHHTAEAHGACVRLAKATAASVWANTSPAYEGEPVELVAQVIARSSRPTGQVRLRVAGTVVGTPALGPDGYARLTVGSIPAGSHPLVAEYDGDAAHSVSTSSGGSVDVRPRRALTELTLRSSADPAPRDVPVTLTATFRTSPSGSTPSGNVVFRDEDGAIGVAPIGSGGTATLSHVFTSPGPRLLRAVYAGDDRHRGSAGDLALRVGTLLHADEVTVEESEVSTAVGDIRLHLSAPVDYDVPVRVAVSGPGYLFPGGAAPTIEAVVPAGATTTTVPLVVAAQLEQATHQIAVGLSTQAADVYVVRSPVPGFVHVTHPTCTIADTAGTGRLRGTDGDDVLCGLDGADDVNGLAGNDLVYGGDGDDQVLGGPGDDRVSGGPGSDRLVAGGGTDRLVAVDGVSGNDRLVGARGTSCDSDPGDIRTGC